MQNKIPISTLYEVYVDGDVAFKGDVLVREPAPQPRRAGCSGRCARLPARVPSPLTPPRAAAGDPHGPP